MIEPREPTEPNDQRPFQPDRYVSPREAGTLTGLSRRTLAALADRGVLGVVRPPGCSRRYRLEDLEALLAAHATHATAGRA